MAEYCAGLNIKESQFSMTLSFCLVRRESLDELEAIVRKDRFELVKNTDVHVPRGEEIGAPEVPFRLQDMGTFVSEAGYLECRRTT